MSLQQLSFQAVTTIITSSSSTVASSNQQQQQIGQRCCPTLLETGRVNQHREYHNKC